MNAGSTDKLARSSKVKSVLERGLADNVEGKSKVDRVAVASGRDWQADEMGRFKVTDFSAEKGDDIFWKKEREVTRC